MELDWGQFVDKVVDGHIAVIPEFTQGYVLPSAPDPFARLRGVGVPKCSDVNTTEARDYLDQHTNYAELLTIVDRSFVGAPIHEQYKTLKHFIDQGANIDNLLIGSEIAIISTDPPFKVLNGKEGENSRENSRENSSVKGVWDKSTKRLLDANSESDVDRLLIRIFKIGELKVDQLKQLGKLVGLTGAYKLKKAELVAALGSL